MKVLLTGATGFIGRHVLSSLRQHDIAFIVLGRSKPVDCSEEEFIRTDLLDEPDFAALVAQAEASHLLHLAWYAEHGKFWTSPSNLRWVQATIRLVESFCESGGQRIVVAGTCAEYDWSYGCCREDTTPAVPATIYGVAKDATRRLTMAICREHGLSCAWGRLFIPYGPGDSSSRLIPSLIDVFLNRRDPFGVSGNLYRDFLHVVDVAEAFLCLLRAPLEGTVNISSGEPVRLSAVVQIIARILDGDPRDMLALSREKEGEPAVLIGENTKLKEYGWKPAIYLEQGFSGLAEEKITANALQEMSK